VDDVYLRRGDQPGRGSGLIRLWLGTNAIGGAMTRRWTPTALALGAGLLLGCATIQNTLEQDRTWAAYRACKAAGRVAYGQIDRVDPDGRWWWSAAQPTRSSYGLAEIEACMREELAKAK
jgi:hypothetical protein